MQSVTAKLAAIQIVVAKIAVWSRDAKSAAETLLAWKDANALAAKIAALLEVVWQPNVILKSLSVYRR
jgi:DNA gyrase inhibitor GyrI